MLFRSVGVGCAALGTVVKLFPGASVVSEVEPVAVSGVAAAETGATPVFELSAGATFSSLLLAGAALEAFSVAGAAARTSLLCACADTICAQMSSAKLNADKTFFIMHSKFWLKV